MPPPESPPPVRGRIILRNTIWNLAGFVLPMAAAFMTIPGIIARLGRERFALLSIVWVVAGYLAILDLGIGRALVRVLSESFALGRPSAGTRRLRVGIALLALVSIAVGTLLFLIGPAVATRTLQASPDAARELGACLRIVGVCAPLILVASAFRSILEARQLFALLTIIRLPSVLAIFVGPWATSFSTRSLSIAVLTWAGAWLFTFVATVRVAVTSSRALLTSDPSAVSHSGASSAPPSLATGTPAEPESSGHSASAFLGEGLWMTVSNMISPVLVYADRFVVASLLSAGEVAFYATPHEIVTRLLVFPRALLPTLFPAFAATLAVDVDHAGFMFRRAVKYVLVAMFPASLLCLAFAREILTLWLGPEFAARSALVMQILSVAIFVNAAAHVPFSLLQAAGLARWTARSHIVELLLYLPALWLVTPRFGLPGVAVAWLMLVSLDTAALFVMAARALRLTADSLLPVFTGIIAALASFAPFLFVESTLLRTALFGIVATAFAILCWTRILPANERAALRRAASGRE